MQKLLGKLVIIAIIVGLLGLYRGWFTVSSSNEPTGGDTSVKVNVDTEQAKEDADSAIGEVEKVGAEVEEKVYEALHGGDGS